MISKIKSLLSNFISPHLAKIKSIILLVLISCVLFLYLRNDYLRDSLNDANTQINLKNEQIEKQNAQIESMNNHVINISNINKQIQEDLANANQNIDTLSDDLRTAKYKLRINATCPSPSATARGVANATAPELTADAREDYLRLRREMNHTESQIKGLQEYIKALPSSCVLTIN